MNPISKKIYSQQECIYLSNYLQEQRDALMWLKQNAVELAVLADVILTENKSAVEYLKRNEMHHFLAFCQAILEEDKAAFKFLLQHHKEWAAVVGMSQGYTKAEQWLINNGLRHYTLVGKTIRYLVWRKDERSRGDV